MTDDSLDYCRVALHKLLGTHSPETRLSDLSIARITNDHGDVVTFLWSRPDGRQKRVKRRAEDFLTDMVLRPRETIESVWAGLTSPASTVRTKP